MSLRPQHVIHLSYNDETRMQVISKWQQSTSATNDNMTLNILYSDMIRFHDWFRIYVAAMRITKLNITVDKDRTSLLPNESHISWSFESESIPSFVRNILFINEDPGIRRIGKLFMNSVHLQTLTFLGFECVEEIEDSFLCNSNVKFLNLKSFNGVKRIGHSFLQNAFTVGYDMSFFKSLTHIGNYFLAYCRERIEKFNFGNMNELQSIGNYFMCGCRRLERVQWKDLNKLTQVGHGFLYDCKRLKSFRCDKMVKLEIIGDKFLCNCINLTDFHSEGLKSLKYIGNYFLCNCIKLKQFSTVSLASVLYIGNDFLGECRSLKCFGSMRYLPFNRPRQLNNCVEFRHRRIGRLPNPSDTNAEEIQCQISSHAIDPCKQSFNISNYQSKDSINSNSQNSGDNFNPFHAPKTNQRNREGGGSTAAVNHIMESQFQLILHINRLNTAHQANKSGLCNLIFIGNRFLSNCHLLNTFNTSEFVNLVHIGDDFLKECYSLLNFKSNGFQSLQYIGNGFLKHCSSLKKMNTQGFINVKYIGEKCLYTCQSLHKFDTKNFKSLSIIGSKFVSQCSNLEVQHDTMKCIEELRNKCKKRSSNYFTCEFLIHLNAEVAQAI